MIITIDASRLLTPKPTGVELYCWAIIKGLLKKIDNLVLYTPRFIPDLPSDKQKILSWRVKKVWSQLRLGLELLICPPDVFFSPAYVIPFLALLNNKTKKIVTIHDVAFIYLPQSYGLFQRYFLKFTTHQAIKYAYKIIVPTQTTKNDLIEYFNCPEEKIKVTYFGYQRQISHRSSSLVNKKKQFLYIGRVENKKNISNLINAFKIFYQQHPDYKLILAGKPGKGFNKIKVLIDKYKFIDYRGYISAEEKDFLLKSSSALVLLSKYEGFGFPILEAFDYQLPVLAADIPVLREVGGEACLFAPPSDLSVIAKKMESIIINKELRQSLIQTGQERLLLFSWAHCIKQTQQILEINE